MFKVYEGLQGYLAHKKQPPVGPFIALCLGTYGDPRRVGVFYERCTPVRGQGLHTAGYADFAPPRILYEKIFNSKPFWQ
jgi:hypothetical protein